MVKIFLMSIGQFNHYYRNVLIMSVLQTRNQQSYLTLNDSLLVLVH